MTSLLLLTLPAALGALTCGDVKEIFQKNECCGETLAKDVNTGVVPLHEADPPVPGVLQGKAGARVLLGLAPDYPPYTSWAGTPLELTGYMVDLGKLMHPMCNVEVEFILSPWSECWTSKPSALYFPEVNEYVGQSIYRGYVHGCTAYTHTKGERTLSLEFTDSVLGGLKTAGILTRLDDSGNPIISPSVYNYSGIKLGDVAGWAPTADTFLYNTNRCAGKKFIKEDAILTVADGNGPAIAALLDGTFDALYIYADQMYQFQQSGDANANGFGTTFAYIHQGMNEWSYNGTTFAISKRGSGLKQVLDPCIEKISKTKNYTQVCEKYFEPSSCIQNEYSSTSSSGPLFYDAPMDVRTDSNTCAEGYCTCSA
ncbi:hypothetical protein AB1Y20_008719 [Prymnesium parvum]|uniref:Solute-binding protein family 3/N-terminal domain-containing protein n=1 Tax=Prymnesium parvum TaxID=97485 RepID=A0AB34ISB2_PRYPA